MAMSYGSVLIDEDTAAIPQVHTHTGGLARMHKAELNRYSAIRIDTSTA